MEVVNTLFLFNLIMASLMVASLASPLAEEYPRTNERTSAFGMRQKLEMAVKPAIVILKNYTQEQLEVVAESWKAEFCPHENGEAQKKFTGAFKKSHECLKEECLPTLEEVYGILMKKTYEREDTVAAIRSYCKVSPKVLDCVDPFITATKACLGDGMKARWTAYRLGQIHPMTDLFCSNEGNRTISFFNDNILECAEKKTKLLRNCTEDFRSYQRFAVECRKMPEVKKCLTDTLEKCEKPSTSGYFKDLHEITFTNYPCVSNNSTI